MVFGTCRVSHFSVPARKKEKLDWRRPIPRDSRARAVCTDYSWAARLQSTFHSWTGAPEYEAQNRAALIGIRAAHSGRNIETPALGALLDLRGFSAARCSLPTANCGSSTRACCASSGRGWVRRHRHNDANRHDDAGTDRLVAHASCARAMRTRHCGMSGANCVCTYY